MECRTGDHVSQGPEIPADIGVQKDRVERHERNSGGERRAAKSEEVQGYDLHDACADLVDRMQSRRGEPIDILGTVMDRMKLPQKARVEEPMRCIAKEIAGDQQLDELDGERLCIKPTR